MAASQLSWCSGGARMKLSKRRAARHNAEASLASAVASQIVLKIARYPRRTGRGTVFGRFRWRLRIQNSENVSFWVHPPVLGPV